MTSLVELNAWEMAAGIRRRRFSVAELVAAHLHEIERLNAELNAIVLLDEERAEASAIEADRAAAAGEPLGVLHGVPFTAKASLATAGLPSSAASLIVPDVGAEHDSAAVARMRRAGAILLGKTNISELATFPDSTNLVYGATRNPVDGSRSAGGSSGGEACAVAARMSPLGIGSDYGGSIRCPAHFCGVAGLRLGIGVLPPGDPVHGLRTAARTMLSTDGPIARSVADLELAVEALCGQQPRGTLPRHVCLVGSRDGGTADPACIDAVETAAGRLQALGLTVVEQQPPFQEALEGVFDELTAMETRIVLEQLLPERTADVSPQLLVQWQSVAELEFDRAAYADALARLVELQSEAESWLDDHPVLLMLAASAPAFALGELGRVYELFDSCKLASALGLPAVVLPVGDSPDGLPVGVQLVARKSREVELLAIAGKLESALTSPPARLSAGSTR